jgi:hypothetical protein
MVSFGDGFYVINNPDNPDQYLSESQGGEHRLDRFPHARAAVGQSVGTRQWRWTGGGTEVSFQLELADCLFTTRQNDRLSRRQRRFQISRLRQDVGTDQSGSDDERSRETERRRRSNRDRELNRRVSLDDHQHRRVAGSKGQIWVGTDDGNLQLTTDGGKNWSNLIKNVPVSPRTLRFRTSSLRERMRARLTSFDRHMFDDFRPTSSKPRWRQERGPTSPAICRRKRTCRSFAKIRRTQICCTRARSSVCLLLTTAAKNWIAVESEEPAERAVHDISFIRARTI